MNEIRCKLLKSFLMNLQVLLGKIPTVLAFIGLIACSSTVKAPEKPVTFPSGDYSYTGEHISCLIQKKMKKHKVTGLSIALVDGQEIVWAYGFGFADLANNIPAKPETVYRAGSISKLFTAIAVLQLAEQGKIDIDQPLQTYLPEFSIKTRFPDAVPITPRTIMTHHSGLPTDWAKGMFTYNISNLSKLRKEYAQLVHEIKDEYVAYPPNFVFNYSNLGFSLLGHMVERVSGKEFINYMDKSVLAPCGMTHSSFWLTPDIESLLSKGYENKKEARHIYGRDLPAGALYSNVLDLGRFMMMVFAGGKAEDQQILRTKTLTEMLCQQNRNIPLDLDFRIGLGWFLDWTGKNLDYAGTVVLHTGDVGAFCGVLMILLEHKLGVVVLANSPAAPMVIDIAIEALKSALKSRAGVSPPERDLSSSNSIPQEEIKKYKGVYSTGWGIISFEMKGKTMKAKLWGRSFKMVPDADRQFSLRYLLLGFIPINVGQLKDVRLSFSEVEGREIVALYQNGMIQWIGEKIPRIRIPKSWQDRLGTYEIINAEDDILIFRDFNFRYEEGLFLLDLTVSMAGDMRITVPLSPINDSEAVILGLGRHMGETIRAASFDGKEGLLYSGYKLIKKEFD